jgi:hypothetical protein
MTCGATRPQTRRHERDDGEGEGEGDRSMADGVGSDR